MLIAKLTGRQIKEIAKPMEKLSKYFSLERSPIKLSYFKNRFQFFCQTLTKQITINVSLEDTVPCDYGQFFIQPEFLFTLAKTLKLKDEILIEQSSGQYYFKNGITLAVEKPTFKDNPEYKEDSSETKCICRCSHWKTVLKQCLLAATAEKNRFDLDVIRLSCTAGSINGISTDGRRMVVSSFDNTEVIQGEVECSIPKSTIEILLPSLQDDIPVDVDIREKSIVMMFQKDDVNLFYQLESKLAEDNFPKWQKILPETTHEITIHKAELEASLSKMAKFSKDDSNVSVWDFNKKRSLTVCIPTGNGKDELSAKIKIQSGGFDPVIFRLNYEFVLDFLHGCQSECVILKQASNSIVFSDTENRFHCLMMRMLSEEEAEQNRKTSALPQAQAA